MRNSVCLTKEKEDEPKAAPKLELHRRALAPVFSLDTLRVLDIFETCLNPAPCVSAESSVLCWPSVISVRV